MTKERLNLGCLGENRCIGFLKKKGYKIIGRNYRCPIGEIDIIARDKDVLCFIEVKTRRTHKFGLPKFGLPQEAVNQHKRNKLIQVALSYIKKKNLEDSNLRFDVIAVSEDIQLIKNAFSADNRYRY